MEEHREKVKELVRWRRALRLPDDGEATRQIALHIHLTSRRLPGWREVLVTERAARADRPLAIEDIALGNHERLARLERERDVPRLRWARFHRDAVSRLRAAIREHRGTTLPYLPDDPTCVTARHELGLVFSRSVIRSPASGPASGPFLVTAAGEGETARIRVRAKGVGVARLALVHLTEGGRTTVEEWETSKCGDGRIALTLGRRDLDRDAGDVEVKATIRLGDLVVARGFTIPGPLVPTEAVVHAGAVPTETPTTVLALGLLPPGLPDGPGRERLEISVVWTP